MRKNKIIKTFILCLSFILCISVFVGCKSTEEKQKHSAYEEAKSKMEGRLKAPSTAEFASYEDSDITKISDTDYKVTSYVDAENSYGSKQRIEYNCKASFSDKNNTKTCLVLKINTTEDNEDGELDEDIDYDSEDYFEDLQESLENQ